MKFSGDHEIRVMVCRIAEHVLSHAQLVEIHRISTRINNAPNNRYVYDVNLKKDNDSHSSNVWANVKVVVQFIQSFSPMTSTLFAFSYLLIVLFVR